MENDLLEYFLCKVMQHTYRRHFSYSKDRGEDRKWRKWVEHQRKGILNKRVSDPFHNFHKIIVFLELLFTWSFFWDTRTCSKCGNMNHVAKYYKIAPHFVKLYKEHGERCDKYASYVEYIETLYNETMRHIDLDIWNLIPKVLTPNLIL